MEKKNAELVRLAEEMQRRGKNVDSTLERKEAAARVARQRKRDARQAAEAESQRRDKEEAKRKRFLRHRPTEAPSSGRPRKKATSSDSWGFAVPLKTKHSSSGVSGAAIGPV